MYLKLHRLIGLHYVALKVVMLVDSSSPSTTSSVSFGFILYSFLWILEGLVQL